MTGLLDARGAERALLGAILMNPLVLPETGLTVADLDPGSPGHDHILAAVQSVVERNNGRCDELMVLSELMSRGTISKIGTTAARGGVYLHELVAACPTATNAGHYAQRVREAAKRRTLAACARRIVQAAEESADLDDALLTIAELTLHLGLTVDESPDAPVPGLSTVEALVDQAETGHDWIVPNLLERHDRFLLLGEEGHGKSWLTRQICVMVASGLHPFRPTHHIPPQRTLIVDLENSPGMVRRHTRPLVAQARNLGVWRDGNAYAWLSPAGLDLRSPGDVRLLDRVIGETRPALVGLGPLYKAHSDRGDSYERIAQEVRGALDMLRDKHRIAWLIEHHLPKAQGGGKRPIVPIGSSLWVRWPEFCRTMVRLNADTWELQMPRGDREAGRDIPLGIRRGGQWPWKPLWFDHEIDECRPAR